MACAVLNKTENKISLKGLVCKEGISLNDGLTILTQKMEKEIFSWCDLRWSNGSEYGQAGWHKLKQINPEC